MFQGANTLNLDVKGRFGIPSKYRGSKLFEKKKTLVLTAHPHRCLLMYPSNLWDPIKSKIIKFSSFDPQLSIWKRILVGFAEEIEVDGSGRLLISPTLRKFASLERKIVLIGQGSHFELWNESLWEKQLSKLPEICKSPPNGLEDFSL